MPGYSKVVQRSCQAMSIRFNNLVYDLKRQGVRVIVLSLGEAFFDIPLYPMDDLPYPALYHYSHSRGIPEIREKVADWYGSQYGVAVDCDSEIIVTAGSKAAIHFSMMSVLDPGDEVLMQEPTWVSYPEQAKFCYAVPILMPYDTSVDDYERYLTPKTKLIVMNNPHNPRGQVLTKDEVRRLVSLAEERDIYLLADEAYSDFLLDEKFYSVGLFDEDKSHVIMCNSISKNFGISGWRIGYVITNSGLIDQILKVNQHLVTCPPTILAQYVAKHFDRIIDITFPQIAATVEARREVARYMDAIGLGYLPGTATFYFFVSIEPSELGSEEFCTRLLMENHISTVPGLGYGRSCDKFIRVSVGTESLEDIKYGLDCVKSLIDATSRRVPEQETRPDPRLQEAYR